MIRLVHTLHRHPDLSLKDFQDYWRRQHGPLVASFAAQLNILRYVQTHTIHIPENLEAQSARGNMEPSPDGIAEVWWETEEALEKTMNTIAAESAVASLIEDEKRFIDLANSSLWLAYEYPQVNPTPENITASPKTNIRRIVYPLRHVESMTENQARHYWLTEHGPLVRLNTAATGVLCYRQVHRANHPLEGSFKAARGTQVDPYLGLAEAWIDASKLPATEESTEARQAHIEDERKFIDFERSTFFFGKELTFIDQR